MNECAGVDVSVCVVVTLNFVHTNDIQFLSHSLVFVQVFKASIYSLYFFLLWSFFIHLALYRIDRLMGECQSWFSFPPSKQTHRNFMPL